MIFSAFECLFVYLPSPVQFKQWLVIVYNIWLNVDAILSLGLVGASPLATNVHTEDSNMPLLALWGQICCRLAARPTCVEQVQMSGFLEVQVQLCRYRSPAD